MTRLALTEEPLPLEPPLKRSLPTPPHRGRFKRACCCLGLIVLLLLGVTVVAAVAKTGIVTVPLFSKLFYALPPPSQVVTVDAAVGERMQRGVAVTVRGTATTITLAEADLTYLVRQLLATGSDSLFSPTVQAVITPGGVELTGLLLKPIRVNLTVVLVPVVRDAQLDFQLKSVTIGALSVPPTLAQRLINPTLQLGLEPINRGLAELGTLRAVTLKEGTLTVEGMLKE